MLASGTRLGPFEIQGSLGAGGMGEVYRALDTRLGRAVAIKMLPPAFTADADRRARFEREARLLATLNHPHIAAIYGLEERDGVHALILELIEGQTLAELLEKTSSARAQGAARGLPIDEVAAIARQIIDALEAAHERGIVHRDLKPGNIMITREGVVKVLDFGLARDSGGDAADGGLEALTATMSGTAAGVILGTAPYMSPEQARGRPVDKRTDIWAFGCVLFELLTGRQVFPGETMSDTVARILERAPDWSALPKTTSPAIRRLLARCLEKDPKRRLRDIGDARVELEDLTAPDAPPASATAPARRPGAARLALWVALGLVAAAGAVWVGTRLARPPAPTKDLVRLTVALPRGASLEGMLALAPDGRTLVYAAADATGRRLYRRRLDVLDPQPIRGTDGGILPFFSPDGAQIGFFVDGGLKRIPLEGGIATMVASSAALEGGTWLADDTIVFELPGRGLARIPASGGEATALTEIDAAHGEIRHVRPVALAGDRAVLFTVHVGAREKLRIDAISLQTGKRTTVTEGNGAFALDAGYLAFEREKSIWVAPFDPDRLVVTGSPTQMLDGISLSGGSGAAATWTPLFTVGLDGSLAYQAGALDPFPPRTLVWVDRAGREQPIDAPANHWVWPRVSPDGKRLGLHFHNPVNMDAWIYELDHGPLKRVTEHPLQDGTPVWTPDGTRIVFWSRQGGGAHNIYQRAADLSGTNERLTTSEIDQAPFSWADGGRLLVFHQRSADTGMDIGVLSMQGDHQARLIINSPAQESRPAVSPDGRWIAYQSNASGRYEVWVQPFPTLDSRWQISTEGGASPTWSRDGRELFFRRGTALLRVPVHDSGGAFAHGNAQVLIDGPYVPEEESLASSRSYDVSPDGQRFLMIKERPDATGDPGAAPIVIIRNWASEVEGRLRAGAAR